MVKEKNLLFDFACALVSAAGDYKKILNLVAKGATEITGCKRACVIIRNKRDELIIKAGYPDGCHGVGKKIISDYGENVLRAEMKGGPGYISIRNPLSDPKMSYLKCMAVQFNFSLVFFAPLFFRREPIGILILDWVANGNSVLSREAKTKIVEQLRLISQISSDAIGNEYQSRKLIEDLRKKERLAVLGENAAKVAHSIRNPLTCIGGMARRIAKNNVANEIIKNYADLIIGDVDRLENILKDVLSFVRISARIPNFSCVNINDLISELKKKHSTVLKTGIITNLDRRLGEVGISIDLDMIKSCFDDMFKNAVQAKATFIQINTKLKLKHNFIVISFINDGDLITHKPINEIFDPFVSTKPDGTGLGLANVKAVITAHDGNITVESGLDEKGGNKTIFKIYLPVKCKTTA